MKCWTKFVGIVGMVYIFDIYYCPGDGINMFNYRLIGQISYNTNTKKFKHSIKGNHLLESKTGINDIDVGIWKVEEDIKRQIEEFLV